MLTTSCTTFLSSPRLRGEVGRGEAASTHALSPPPPRWGGEVGGGEAASTHALSPTPTLPRRRGRGIFAATSLHLEAGPVLDELDGVLLVGPAVDAVALRRAEVIVGGPDELA